MKKIPVTTPYFDGEEQKAAAEAITSGWVAQGPRVAEFEKQIAAHEGVKEGVATTSCTTALHLAMAAQGLGPGMDAIAPAFTFVATENAIVMTGATPVMTDIRHHFHRQIIDILKNDPGLGIMGTIQIIFFDLDIDGVAANPNAK